MHLWCLLISHEWTCCLSKLCKRIGILTIHVHRKRPIVLLLLLLLHEWIKLFEILLIHRWTLIVLILATILLCLLILLIPVSLRL